MDEGTTFVPEKLMLVGETQSPCISATETLPLLSSSYLKYLVLVNFSSWNSLED